MANTPGADYLAVIPIGGGSSWGRSPDKEEAIRKAIACLRDWEVYYKLSNVEVTINVVDVQGYSTCSWDSLGLRGENETTGEDETIKRPIEHIKRMTPKWRKRA